MFFLIGTALFLAGCGTNSPFLGRDRYYRDPITYSFEADTPYPENGPSQLLTQTKEAAEQIREWEKKHLW